MSSGPEASLSPLKRALLRIEELEAQLAQRGTASREPIAIVGIGCRFPGHVRTPDDFWRLLHAGADATCDVPLSRWDIDACYDPRPATSGKLYTRRGGFLDDIDLFDPQFFGIAPREASSMDPQQRLLLEVAWEALENSGQSPSGLMGSRTGVFVGLCTADYSTLQLDGSGSPLDAYYASGTAHSVAAGRLSYVLGLKGPTLAVDTACSSSLVAVHLACQSLRARECDLAIAGGVNAILSPENTIALCQAAMLSADGRCKSFDDSADGYGRSEGCGIVILRRLSDAKASRHRIWALVRGSAINHDGASSGLTAPNGSSQQSVIRDALADGGVHPADVSYVEAHGTGTRLGDPIEVQALAAVFGESHSTTAPLVVGSVKTNIGHTEAAAGVAGLIKVALAMRHGEIPAHLHIRTPNGHIPWAEIPLTVPAATVPWNSGGVRIAGVSSFGFSGTNAHVVLEEGPPLAPVAATVERPRHVLCLSARSEAALRTLAARYAAHLESQGDDIGDVCFTANAGRAHWEHRVVLPADDTTSLLTPLRELAVGAGPAIVSRAVPDEPRVGFLFTGQGAQYPGMARRLYDTQPTFRRAFDRCAAVLDGTLPYGLAQLVFAQPGSREAVVLDETRFTQPATVAVEYALAELWQSWGVRPSAVMGHSVGEFTAAVVAGACSLEDGLRLVAERGRLMQSLPSGGSMIALFADEATVARAISLYAGRVSIAAINGPEHVVISGSTEHVRAVADTVAQRGVRNARLTVSHAFHSPLLDPILDDFERAAGRTAFCRPTVPLVSNLTGAMVALDELSEPGYWRRHLREPVRFAEGLATLRRARCNALVEMGPSPVLLGMIARGWPDHQMLLLPSLRREGDDWRVLLDSVGQAYAAGVPIDWEGFDRDYKRRRVTLPTYPFERTRCWIAGPLEGEAEERSARPSANAHGLLGTEISTPLPQRIFAREYSTISLPFLADHVVHDVTVLPTTVFIEIARAAGRECLHTDRVAIEDLTIQALALPADATCSIQVVVEPMQDGASRFRLFAEHESINGLCWMEHAVGSLRHAEAHTNDAGIARLDEVRTRCTETVDIEQFYKGIHARGLQFGPAFRSVRALARRDGEAIAEIDLSPSLHGEASACPVHPVLLDGAIQIMAAAVPGFAAGDLTGAIYMPVALDEYQAQAPADAHVISRAWLASEQAGLETLCGHVDVYTPDGDVVARFRGLRMKRTDPAALERAVSGDRDAWAYTLRWLPLELETRAAHAPSTASTVTASVEKGWTSLCIHHDVAVYDQVNPALDDLSQVYAVAALKQLGWNPAVGDKFSIDSLMAGLHVQPRYRRLIERLFEILGGTGVVAEDADGLSVVTDLPEVNAANAVTDAFQRCAGQQDELAILMRCGASFADALRGVADPLELLFPDGDIESTARIYKTSPLARAFNAAMCEAVDLIVKALPFQRPLRVLEIGGGTGGTTVHLLERMPADRTEYVFTDVGQAFVSKAERALAQYPFIRFAQLDIECEPAQQGFEAGSFDLIVASNVIHATRDVETSLANTRQLLAPGGWLLLLEGTRPQPWLDLTFGLTDGWWRFADIQRRSYPLMSRASWLQVLSESGFTDVSAVPAVDSGLASSQNAIFVARVAAPSRPVGDGWLVFTHENDIVADGLSRDLARRGGEVFTVRPAAAWAADEHQYEIDPEAPEHFVRLLADVRERLRSPLRGVVYMWAADDQVEDVDTRVLSRQQRHSARGALSLIQALAGGPNNEVSPRLWLVSRGAQQIAEHPGSVAIGHAPLWGLGRTARMEHPDLNCVNVDLDSSDAQHDLLLAELLGAGDAREVAFRGRERLVATLMHAGNEIDRATGATQGTARAYVEVPGDLTSIRVVHTPRRRPTAEEVEVGVRAAGLNFRDVLNAIGMRHDAESLGGEFAGVVLSVGDGVTSVGVGDAVMGLARGSLSNVIVASEQHLVPIPSQFNFQQAATIPIAFMTAHYALTIVGQLRCGERVLVHAAAGGVGLAAVQLARRAGAVVFAAAGTEEKRSYLRERGVAHVVDSRSLDFADEIRAATGGHGVDVVIGAITGDICRRSLELLSPGGRFLDLGHAEHDHADDSSARRLDIDLSVRLSREPGLARRLFAGLVPMFEDGRLEPLPTTTFPLERAASAFMHMARAKHVGKIVIVPPTAASAPADTEWVPRSDATYLITGGLSGLGPLVAEWLVRRGARHLALLSRRAPEAQVQDMLAGLRREGATIQVWQADVADQARMSEVIDSIDHHMPPLRGVFHLAGVLDDGVLLQQTWERFAAVMRPKMDGAWVLHRLTREHALDQFVLFSSVSALFGSPAQANHSAANAFLDAFAHFRRSIGLPALSINWGVWSGAGAAVSRGADERTEVLGVKPISPGDGLKMLERMMATDAAQVAAVPLDAAKFVRHFPRGAHPGLVTSLAAGLRPAVPQREELQRHPGTTDTPAAPAPARSELSLVPFREHLGTLPAGRQRSALQSHIQTSAARVLGLAAAGLDRRTPLNQLGLDSLMAVELRNALAASIDRPLPATLLFDYPTIEILTDYIGGRVLELDDMNSRIVTHAQQSFKALSARDLLDRVESMSDDDVEGLLESRSE